MDLWFFPSTHGALWGGMPIPDRATGEREKWSGRPEKGGRSAVYFPMREKCLPDSTRHGGRGCVPCWYGSCSSSLRSRQVRLATPLPHLRSYLPRFCLLAAEHQRPLLQKCRYPFVAVCVHIRLHDQVFVLHEPAGVLQAADRFFLRP